jgi:hypothetical protein
MWHSLLIFTFYVHRDISIALNYISSTNSEKFLIWSLTIANMKKYKYYNLDQYLLTFDLKDFEDKGHGWKGRALAD